MTSENDISIDFSKNVLVKKLRDVSEKIEDKQLSGQIREIEYILISRENEINDFLKLEKQQLLDNYNKLVKDNIMMFKIIKDNKLVPCFTSKSCKNYEIEGECIKCKELINYMKKNVDSVF